MKKIMKLALFFAAIAAGNQTHSSDIYQPITSPSHGSVIIGGPVGQPVVYNPSAGHEKIGVVINHSPVKQPVNLSEVAQSAAAKLNEILQSVPTEMHQQVTHEFMTQLVAAHTNQIISTAQQNVGIQSLPGNKPTPRYTTMPVNIKQPEFNPSDTATVQGLSITNKKDAEYIFDVDKFKN